MGVDLAERPTQSVESQRTDFKVRINQADLPWVSESSLEVPLTKISGPVGEFLFGSAIRGKSLVDAANQLDEHRSEITNNLMYTHLPQFAEGFNPYMKLVEDVRTRQPIFYVGNKGGQRVYFMRFGKVDNMPVIVRIAACDKARQIEVLETITTNSRKRIKATYKVS